MTMIVISPMNFNSNSSFFGFHHSIIFSLDLVFVLLGFSSSISKINGRCCVTVSPCITLQSLRSLNSVFVPGYNQSLAVVSHWGVLSDVHLSQGRIQVLRNVQYRPILCMASHVAWPSVIRRETPSFWRLRPLSFEGHLERKKMQYIFGNQV